MHELKNNTLVAIKFYQQSIRLEQYFFDGLLSLGNIYLINNKLKLAHKYLTKAKKINHNHEKILYLLGKYFVAKENFLHAKKHFQQILQLNPSNNQAKFATAWCDYKMLQPYHLELNNLKNNNLISPFESLYLISNPKMQLDIAREFFKNLTQGINRFAPFVRKKKSKITLGYISPDLSKHAVGFLMKDVIINHDKKKFQINCYSLSNTADNIQKAIASGSDNFKALQNHSAYEIAKCIFADNVDILIDLSGYTKFAKPEVLAYKPAFIQCSMCGYPGTLGTKCVDYIIASKTLIPEYLNNYYDEKIVYLPETVDIFAPNNDNFEMIRRDELGLPGDKFVFCCLNSEDRIELEVLKLWAKILNSAPHSVLWLFSPQPIFKKIILNFFYNNNINPNRIFFTPPEILSTRYIQRLADIWLDTLVLTGGTANILNCWCGLPSVTLLGKMQHHRTGASILTAANLVELIAPCKRTYINIALYYYNNPNKLINLRKKMISNNKNVPLFNIKKFMLNYEKLLISLLKSTK